MKPWLVLYIANIYTAKFNAIYADYKTINKANHKSTMSTISFCLTVGVLIMLSVWSNEGSPPPLPHTGKFLYLLNDLYTYNKIGVQLYGGYNRTSYPNNSMIPANYFYDDDKNNDTLIDALWCQSARNDSNIGIWYYPDDSQVSAVDETSPLHTVHMSGQIGLYRDDGINNYEGIYTCIIPDEHNVNQTLFIALYKLDTYKASSELHWINKQ